LAGTTEGRPVWRTSHPVSCLRLACLPHLGQRLGDGFGNTPIDFALHLFALTFQFFASSISRVVPDSLRLALSLFGDMTRMHSSQFSFFLLPRFATGQFDALLILVLV
jgi:hypothetical protein